MRWGPKMPRSFKYWTGLFLNFFSTSDNAKAVRLLNNPPKVTARKTAGRAPRSGRSKK